MERVSRIPGLSLPIPDGAFYVFPRVEGLTDSMGFARTLLKRTRVAIGPGSAFGRYGEGYIRISFAASEQVLIPALDRIDEFMRNRAEHD
jgi:aspartate/methionine/tyrosine aminotransferase